MKQFITITDGGQEYKIPDAFITAKIQNDYKNLPKLQAWSRAIGDWIEQHKLETQEEA